MGGQAYFPLNELGQLACPLLPRSSIVAPWKCVSTTASAITLEGRVTYIMARFTILCDQRASFPQKSRMEGRHASAEPLWPRRW